MNNPYQDEVVAEAVVLDEMEETALPAVEEGRRRRAPLRSPHAHGGGGGGGDREPRGSEVGSGAEETGLRRGGSGGRREEGEGFGGGRGDAGSGARRESPGGCGGGGGDGHALARDRSGCLVCGGSPLAPRAAVLLTDLLVVLLLHGGLRLGISTVHSRG